MNNIKVKRSVTILLTIALCITLFSFSASAFSNTKGSISISALDKETKEPISDAVFRVYSIASVYENDDGFFFVYTDSFKDNGMDMGDFSDAYLPIHLAVYAASKSLSYTEKATDTTGTVVFDNLPIGVYLVVPVSIQEGYINPNPFIITVPTRDDVQDKWIYNINATPKVEIDKEETAEKTYISVKKYWQSTEKTPDSITVSLIKDGAVCETVNLNAANNWYHKWENLDKNHSWSVVETDVPEGYKVSYVTSQMTVVITNTDADYEEETTTTPQDTTTSSDDTTKPDGTTNPTGTTKPTGTTESTTKREELIKTGQLNWPVPVFSIAGLLLFSIGWVMFNSGKKDEEAV